MVTVFGILSIVDSPAPPIAIVKDGAGTGNTAVDWNMSTKKLKWGLDAIYTPLYWLGFNGRFDYVQPDLDAAYAHQGNPGGSDLNFGVHHHAAGVPHRVRDPRDRCSSSTSTTCSGTPPIQRIPTSGSPRPTATWWGSSPRCGGRFAMKGFSMIKVTLLAVGLAGALGAVGCFGGDPNVPSMLLYPDAGNPGLTGAGGKPGLGPIVGKAVATFDTSVSGFALDGYHDDPSTMRMNLADPAVIEMTGNTPTLAFDSTDGNPDPGSLQIGAAFSGKNQHIDIQSPSYISTGAGPQDWSGGKLHVRIKIVSGAVPTGGAQVFVKTTSNYVYGGTYTNIGGGSDWKEFTLDLTAPMTMNSGYDASQVVSYGVQVSTGDSAPSTQGPVTFLIDSFFVSGIAGGTGGTGGAAGAAGSTGAAAAAVAAAGRPARPARAVRVARPVAAPAVRPPRAAPVAARARARAPTPPSAATLGSHHF